MGLYSGLHVAYRLDVPANFPSDHFTGHQSEGLQWESPPCSVPSASLPRRTLISFFYSHEDDHGGLSAILYGFVWVCGRRGHADVWNGIYGLQHTCLYKGFMSLPRWLSVITPLCDCWFLLFVSFSFPLASWLLTRNKETLDFSLCIPSSINDHPVWTIFMLKAAELT